MIVLVGSTKPAKVDGVREALGAVGRIDARFAAAAVIPHDLTHVAPRMPMSVDEILDGAVSRATALSQLPHFHGSAESFAVGLEGGLHRLTDREWTLQSWAAVTNGSKWGYGAGPTLLLPAHLAEQVTAGAELGDVIDALSGEHVRGTRGAWGVLTRDLISRADAFRLAVLAAFAPFYNPRAWLG